MSNQEIQRLEALTQRLRALTETQLRYFLTDFLRKYIGQTTHLVHGNVEHGADIIVVMNSQNDPLNKGQTLFIQAKAGNVGLAEWRQNLAGQIAEMYYR